MKQKCLEKLANAGVFLLGLLTGCATAPEIQGHRGARGLLPENTLPAFTRALEIGVDVLELDVGVTRDQVVVVSHDPCFNVDLVRGPDGEWVKPRAPNEKYGLCLNALTVAEVEAHDVGRLRPGSDYAKRFAAQQPVDGTRVPTLDAAIAAAMARSGRVRFNIETKLSPMRRDETLAPEPFVQAVLAVIRRHGVAHRVTLQSFDWRTLKVVQTLAPDIPTVYLSVQQKWEDNIRADAIEGSAWTAGLNAREFGGSVPRMVKAAGGRIWSPYFGDLTPAKVVEAHALGLKVVVWTVNEPKDIARMIDMKVDGILSDYPDRVRSVYLARGLPLPR
jgi:glycerophosphoryl diester phosphodiesterase